MSSVIVSQTIDFYQVFSKPLSVEELNLQYIFSYLEFKDGSRLDVEFDLFFEDSDDEEQEIEFVESDGSITSINLKLEKKNTIMRNLESLTNVRIVNDVLPEYILERMVNIESLHLDESEKYSEKVFRKLTKVKSLLLNFSPGIFIPQMNSVTSLEIHNCKITDKFSFHDFPYIKSIKLRSIEAAGLLDIGLLKHLKYVMVSYSTFESLFLPSSTEILYLKGKVGPIVCDTTIHYLLLEDYDFNNKIVGAGINCYGYDGVDNPYEPSLKLTFAEVDKIINKKC